MTPALERLARIANALGDRLRERVVFIGGSILPLLETEQQVFAAPRPTKDVDAVVLTYTYTQKGALEEQLRERGFRHSIEPGAHADKWISPDGVTFDLVSCGDHLGGNGSPHDEFAVETAVSIDLPPLIRYASAVGFLTLKCGAFRDRGKKAPIASKDLMDIVALAATRPKLPEEVAAAPEHIRRFIKAEVLSLLESRQVRSAIPSHIRDLEPLADDAEDVVMSRLTQIATAE